MSLGLNDTIITISDYAIQQPPINMGNTKISNPIFQKMTILSYFTLCDMNLSKNDK